MRVHAIQTGLVRVKEAQLEGLGHGFRRRLAPLFEKSWTGWLPTYAWAIEHDEGVIVVDTGAAAHLKSLPSWHPYFRSAVQFDIEPEQEAGPQLKELGIGPRDVRTVVLTHLHIDHCGGLHHFPHSTVRVGRRELAGARGLWGRLNGYLPQRWPSFFDPVPFNLASGPMPPFAKTEHITKDGCVVVVPTPGHTAGHHSLAVREDGRAIFLAGDASYNQELMLRGALDGITADEKTAFSTLRTIQQFGQMQPTVYLPTHDPAAKDRLDKRIAA